MTEAKTRRGVIRVVWVAVLVVVAAGVSYRYARNPRPATTAALQAPVSPRAEAAADQRKVLYWYDPMRPDQHFDKPGRSPFMAMDLVPRYAEAASTAASVTLAAPAARNLDLRTVEVESGTLNEGIEALGEFQYNQRDVAILQTRAEGFVERVYAHAPGDSVARGAPVVDLLIPSWGSAQQEFLGVLELGDARLVAAARTRLRLLGMSEDLIEAVERSRKPQATITLRAPLAGVIITLDVRSGMSVAAGTTLATFNGSDPVWLEVLVPERLAGELQVGTALSAAVASYPEARFKGAIAALLPAADAVTRSVRIRASFANADGRLRPGLSARVYMDAPHAQVALLLPSTAVIRGGERDLVMRADGEGRYTPVQVRLGREAAGRVEILGGLAAGEKVAVSAQFLLDAEANLQGLAPVAIPAMEIPQ